MSSSSKPPRWFLVLWPITALWALYMLHDWPTWQVAPLPLLLGGLWLLARRWSGTQRLLTTAFIAAVVASVVVMQFDTVQVTSRQDLESVTFGWPVGWLTQDLTTLDPPLPFDQGPATLDQANRTQVSYAGWVATIAAFMVPATAVLWFVRRKRERAKTSAHPAPHARAGLGGTVEYVPFSAGC